MIDLLPRGGSIHVDGGHSLPVVVLCYFVVVLPVFERGAVCVVPVLASLIFSVHGGHNLPVVWMCVFHGGHSLPVVWMCVVFHDTIRSSFSLPCRTLPQKIIISE